MGWNGLVVFSVPSPLPTKKKHYDEKKILRVRKLEGTNGTIKCRRKSYNVNESVSFSEQ